MLSTLLMGICGIFYTSIGGIKAVVWTDFIQGLMMYVGTSVILIKVLIKIEIRSLELKDLNMCTVNIFKTVKFRQYLMLVALEMW